MEILLKNNIGICFACVARIANTPGEVLSW